MPVTDHDQIRLFAKLEAEAGLSSAVLADLFDISQRTAHRVMAGESWPSYADMKRLAHRNHRAAGLVFRDMTAGTGWLTFDADADPALSLDRGLTEALRQAADCIDQRAEHLSDGHLEEDEQREQLASLDKLISGLLAYRSGVAQQPTTKRHKLGMAGGAA